MAGILWRVLEVDPCRSSAVSPWMQSARLMGAVGKKGGVM
jgi:hypothetical protein